MPIKMSLDSLKMKNDIDNLEWVIVVTVAIFCFNMDSECIIEGYTSDKPIKVDMLAPKEI